MFGDEKSRFDVAHVKAATWFGGGSVAEIDISGFLIGVSLSILSKMKSSPLRFVLVSRLLSSL
jgi:hypothetical protein